MRDEITFILNNEIQQVSGLSGQMTLLAWLRRQRRLTGTKEGCAEGDCGACTVVLARPDADGRIVWRPVNACILFIGMLEGASVTTIEGLSDGGDGLHPCQQAMVDKHASQCGFCTPGFVMSLFAAWCNGTGLEDASIDDTLAGNLCRCTGYRPIVAAAQALAEAPLPASEQARRAREAELLATIAHEQTVRLSDGKTSFLAPATPAEFSRLYGVDPENTTIVAGATDVGLWVTKQNRALPTLLWTGRVAGFAEIMQTPGALRIGPAVTHQQALAGLAARWPDLGEGMRRFGSLQVRSSGTLCGNIANGSPIGDLSPMLIALGASVELTAGARVRAMPLEAFFVDYGVQDREAGEFVSALLLPDAGAPNLRCYKISKRFDQDISAVMGAFDIEVKDGVIAAARLAFGGMAATPRRASATEAALIGKPLAVDSFRIAAATLGQDFTPISDMRASADYRMQVARNLLLKYGLELTGQDPLRLAGQAGLARAVEWGVA